MVVRGESERVRKGREGDSAERGESGELTAGSDGDFDFDSESDVQAELEVSPPSASLRGDGCDAYSEKKERLEEGEGERVERKRKVEE